MSPQNNFSDIVHPDLITAQKLVYEPNGLDCKVVEIDIESKEYGACTLQINNLRAKFRVGKITPTKIGQFVTLWKRIGKGPIQPYDITDPVDLFIVSVRNNQHFGQFIFPKEVLYEKGVLSKNEQGGKRAMRIYPPWDQPDNSQAQKSQHWQLNYFFEIGAQGTDRDRIQKLFLTHIYETIKILL